MRWTWDPAKAAANLKAHGVGFELAVLVFDDPFHVTVPNAYPGEERWTTVGSPWTGSPVVLVVVHTLDGVDADGPEGGRIISARKAVPSERRQYAAGRFP